MFSKFCIKSGPNINSHSPSKPSCQGVLVTTSTSTAPTANTVPWKNPLVQWCRGRLLCCLAACGGLLSFCPRRWGLSSYTHGRRLTFLPHYAPEIAAWNFSHHPVSSGSVLYPYQPVQFLLPKVNRSLKFSNRKQAVLKVSSGPGTDNKASHCPIASCLG